MPNLTNDTECNICKHTPHECNTKCELEQKLDKIIYDATVMRAKLRLGLI